MSTANAMHNLEHRNPRILIVDDKPQVRKDLRFILELSGKVEVIGEASGGLEAVHMARNLRPDMILMDLEMPGMNGYEAVPMIKKEHPDCIVIALTIHGDAESRRRAILSGMEDVIEKGVPLQTLLQSLSFERKIENGNKSQNSSL